jgi:monoamine oxidase
MNGTPETDVAIVGAGLAGLVAARRLAEAKRSPLILEARPRVGGRLLNEYLGNGKVVEVGGQWIGPTQHRLADLAAELGVGTFPTHDQGRHLIEIAGKLTS